VRSQSKIRWVVVALVTVLGLVWGVGHLRLQAPTLTVRAPSAGLSAATGGDAEGVRESDALVAPGYVAVVSCVYRDTTQSVEPTVACFGDGAYVVESSEGLPMGAFAYGQGFTEKVDEGEVVVVPIKHSFAIRIKKSKDSRYCLALRILTQGTDTVRYQNEICRVGEVIDVSN